MQKTAIYTSTPLQNGLLFNSLANEDGVDIIQVICQFPEAIQVEAFLHAWHVVGTRHEILRTAFRWKETDQPMLETFPETTISFHRENWCDCAEEERQGRLENYLRADRQRSFTPWIPPLWRVALFQLAHQLHWCVLTFHHAILDGRSLPIILSEVFACYRTTLSGAPDKLPPAQPYQAYTSWWQQQDQTANEAFWRQMLAGFKAPIPLPEEDRHFASPGEAGPALAGISHDEQDLILSPALSLALRQFATEHHLTLNVLLQGAWALLLGCYSGQDDIVFGEIRSCRRNTVENAEKMVGFFLNTLPIRIYIDQSMPLILWLQGIRASHLSLRQHQLAPLLQVQQWSEVPTGTPLFTSLFVFENHTLESILRTLDSDWLLRRITIRRKPGYPLACYVFAEPEILIKLVYDPRRFSQATMQRLLAQLRHLLTQMVTVPETTLAELSLLTPEERQQMLSEWNATVYHYDTQTCIQQHIEAVAACAPDALAIQAGEHQFTYAQLNKRANQLAHLLRSQGVGPEVRVGVCMAHSPELLIGQLGVLKAGGAFVSLDPDSPKERLTFMLQNAQVPILLTSHDLAPIFFSQAFQTIALDTATSLLSVWPDRNPEPLTYPSNIAYIIYTSGSTGRPKGVAIHHDSLANLVAWHQRVYALHATDRTTHLASPAFDASVWEIWPSLVAGASLHLPDRETLLDPHALITWYTTHAITVTFLPTPLGEAVLQEQWPVESALRALLVGGDRLQRAPGMSIPFGLYNHYGLTETTVVATWTQISPAATPELAPPIGRPMDNLQTYVLDERGQLVPIGVVGELYIGGAGLARGYLLRPDLTAERFLPDPWSRKPGARLYRSGDLVRYRADGQIEFIGRRDHQVKLRGHRIELGEIEATLAQHPGVATALVLMSEINPNNRKTTPAEANVGQTRQLLVAYIVPHSGVTLTPEELRRFLSQKLPAYMIPARIMLLDTLPLTSNGKIDRRALPTPTDLSISPAAEAPRTPLETVLAEIWTRVLGQSRIFNQAQLNIHESFFALGGHSLLAAQLILRINETLHLHLPINSIFDAPTIAQMAALISEHRNSQAQEEPLTIPLLDRSRYRSNKRMKHDDN